RLGRLQRRGGDRLRALPGVEGVAARSHRRAEVRVMGAATAVLLAAQVLTLEQAVKTAVEHHPVLHQASAAVEAAAARADEARAPLLPQANASATYQRATGNFAPRQGTLPKSVTATSSAS